MTIVVAVEVVVAVVRVRYIRKVGCDPLLTTLTACTSLLGTPMMMMMMVSVLVMVVVIVMMVLSA